MGEYKTDYLGIHERAYAKLLNEGRASWSQADDIEERIELFSSLYHSFNPHKSNPMTLVLGCGTGDVSLGLASQGFEVTGIDISPSAIHAANERARSLRQRATFLEASVLALPVPAATFDLVIDDHCFHCIIGADRQVFLAEALKALKPGGLLIIKSQGGDPPPETPTEFMTQWDPVHRTQAHNGIAGRQFNQPEQILEEVKEAGFRIVDSHISVEPEGWKMIQVRATR